MGSLSTSAAAWLLLPVVLLIVVLGLGLLAERVLGARLPLALVAPFGLCVTVLVAHLGYALGLSSVVVTPVVVILTLLGLFLARAELRARLRPGPAGLAGLAIFGLYLAPVVLAGGWTWTGYNFVNDTAVQFLLADHLKHDGASLPVGPPVGDAVSTGSEHVRTYLLSGYPTGSHALLATVDPLVPAPLEAIYQPLIALLMALTAATLVSLARRAGLSAVAAGLAGFAAAAANLTYQYALQGNVKEIAALATITVAAAVGREALTAERPVPLMAGAAVCLAAALGVYSTAALPYAGLLAILLLAGALLQRGSKLRGRLLVRAAVVGSVVGVMASAGTLPKLIDFGRSASNTFVKSSADPAVDLGHLLRPLELAQAAGIWLTGDYRVPVAPGRELPNVVLIAVMVILMVLGVAWLYRRRETGPLLLLGTTALTLAIIGPRVSPYADGKLMALLSPSAVFVAAFGIALLVPLWRPGGYALAVVAAGGILLSNAFAYQRVQLAPTDRMTDMQQVAERYRDEPELVLVNEADEYAKHFMNEARVNVATDAITPRQVDLRIPQSFAARYFDLDEHKLEYVEQFPVIIHRRSPDASRPPSNFSLDHTTRYYEAWRRDDDSSVLEHLPVGALKRAAAVPSCQEVKALARRAGPDEVLVAAPARDVPQLDVVRATRSPGWVADPGVPGTVQTATPGSARARARFEGGRYRVWIHGSFGREVRATLDGRTLGGVRGVDSPGQWKQAATVDVEPGAHTMTLERSGGGLGPGNGFSGSLGPLAFEQVEGRPLVTIEPEQASAICGQEVDWVERVRRR